MKDAPRATAPAAADDDLTVSPQLFADQMTRLGRVLRSARGDSLSLEVLAERSGVSAGLLSQIERGIGNPSFQTLLRVAGALGLSLAQMLDSGKAGNGSDEFVVRHHERRTMAWPKEQVSFEVLTPRHSREVSILRSILAPHSFSRGFYDPRYYRGIVVLYVQRETVSVRLQGSGSRLLERGDTLTVDSALIAEVGNPGDTPAELITVIVPGGL